MKKILFLSGLLIAISSMAQDSVQRVPINNYVTIKTLNDSDVCLGLHDSSGIKNTMLFPLLTIKNYIDSTLIIPSTIPPHFSGVVQSSSTINILNTDFNGHTVYLCTNTSGVQILHLPSPSTVSINTILWIKLNGRNIPHLYPYASELLEGQAASVGYWPIPSVLYMTGPFLPVQIFGIYADGTNWHLNY